MHRCDFLTPDTLFHLPAKNSLVKAAPQNNIGLIAHISSELTQLQKSQRSSLFCEACCHPVTTSFENVVLLWLIE